jgi:hypothetical protein
MATNDLRPGQLLEGFRIHNLTPLPQLRAVAVRGEHVQSGAQLLHVYTEADTENCFAITFPTPPPDDTGLPHIMEHAVLGGSKRFPVREPFFEMVKMSMATFINAMTYQAFTVYPVATNVKKDFFNLAEVYVDAVFHPELREATFRREGHHFTLENNSDLASALKVTGIVYNEMKGAYSSPESLMYELAGRGLFPDTPLGRDSGGDPDFIPELTFEQFRRFHQTFYHPSNALFYIYGDIPTAEHLRFLAPTLNAFDRRETHVAAPRQARWEQPRRVEKEYPIGATEDATARTFFTFNWVVGDALDPAVVTEWEVVSRILLGNEAAPLKKAIIDSQLGADVFFAGTWASAYEQEFHVGLKGTEADRAEKFERLVLDTLDRIASQEIPLPRVEAAFQQLAYDTLEVKTLFPLHLLEATNSAWPYGGDPLTFLRMSEHLAACRQRFATNPQLFNRLIRDGLLANHHRSLIVLRPDAQAQARADAAFAKRMAEQRAKFQPVQIAAIAKDATELEAAQGVPNSPEALAKLPQLKVSDLPQKPRHIPTEIGQIAGIEVLRNDVFANGVNYVELDVDLAGLPAELYAWLPRFTDAVNKMGTTEDSFEKIAERRSACTGGLWCYTSVVRHASEPSRTLRRMRFGLKTLDEQAGNAFDLLGDLLFSVNPRDPDRLRDVMTQTRAAYRTALVNDGLGTARRQAARGLSPEGAIEHGFLSPDALRGIEDLTAKFDSRASVIMANVERIRDFLANRRRWTISFTGSDPVFQKLSRTLADWKARMRDEAVVDIAPPFHPFSVPPREGLAGPMKIAHCAKVLPAPHLAHPDTPLLRLGLYLARFDYLLPEIRFKGNAYGAGVSHDDTQDTLAFYSYRDPRIVETLHVFDRFREYVASQDWTQTDMDRAIIGSAKEAERPIRPGEATGQALVRRVRGDTNELRERRYAASVRATPAAVKETVLRTLDTNEPRAAVCVVSSREKLAEANSGLGGRTLSVSDILP